MLDSETGNTHEVLSLPLGAVNQPRLSRDDRWLYFQKHSPEADIWMLTLNEKR